METTIQVKSATLSTNKEWYNITTADNRKFSVAANKNPKLKELIENAQAVPYQLTGNITVKNGKVFLWDSNQVQGERVKVKGMDGQTRTDLLIVAQCCLKSVCELYSGKVHSFDAIVAEADKAFNWVLSKSQN
jgi:hypothetical protein